MRSFLFVDCLLNNVAFRSIEEIIKEDWNNEIVLGNGEEVNFDEFMDFLIYHNLGIYFSEGTFYYIPTYGLLSRNKVDFYWEA